MKALQALLRKKDFTFIRRLLKTHSDADVFLVGGIIRDVLLKRESKDYDFVVRNVSAGALKTFLGKLGWTDLVGRAFGVIKFLPRGSKLKEPIDVALPRTEHAFNTGGYKDVDVQSNPHLPIEKDLSRRDFTINALAYDVKEKKLIDLYQGRGDIKKKLIRTVGRPEERFKEDFSRMLRAIRFACQLGFAIEPKTWKALRNSMRHINKKVKGEFVVPRETIARELVKAFVADPARAFELYDKSGATKMLMPELLKMRGCPQPRNFHAEGDVWKHTRIALENLNAPAFKRKFGKEPPSPELVLALVFHDLGKPYTIERKDRLRFNNHDIRGSDLSANIMKRLRISSAGVDVDRAVWLTRKHMLVTHAKKSPMKRTTLEKYFFNDRTPGRDLLKLTYADVMATIPPSGKPDYTDYKNLEQQLTKLKALDRKKKKLPQALLSGHDIMRITGEKPGPRIGELKTMLREEQLNGSLKTKQQAVTFLKKHA